MLIYSQSDEQPHILKHFGSLTGRFLDIGAYDGKAFSNTHALANLGWKGVCVEPSPTAFKALLQLYHTNHNIECLNAAIAVKPGIVQFWDSNGDAVSTTSDTHAKVWGTIVGFKKFWVQTTDIETILAIFGDQFDMVNLDVESTNIEILHTLPLDRMGVRLICVEFDGDIPAVKDYCKGFIELHRTNENIILGR